MIACFEDQDVIGKILAHLRDKKRNTPTLTHLTPPTRAPPETLPLFAGSESTTTTRNQQGGQRVLTAETLFAWSSLHARLRMTVLELPAHRDVRDFSDPASRKIDEFSQGFRTFQSGWSCEFDGAIPFIQLILKEPLHNSVMQRFLK